ncbi:MAG: alpha/beta fold hydrolase [Ruthenibacterium sp.]
MLEVLKNAIKYKSANGTDTIAAFYYTCPAVKPRCILQISHGMCEYIGRYDAFAGFMAQNGFVVCGNDHLGHGDTSRGEGGIDGYFAKSDGRKYVLQDLHRMNSLVCKDYPGLPLILLGHSMGSFFARLYAATYPETLQGLILSGTGGPNPLGKIGVFLTGLIEKVKGGQYRSNFINNMAFGSYLKQIEHPNTKYDWISRDSTIVKTYAQDPKCTYIFTVSAFHEMMCTLQAVSTQEWADKVNPKMPIFLLSGSQDPVGDYGKGVKIVHDMLQKAGGVDVSMTLYENGRHEMLNEINRDEVYADVLAWCNAHVLPQR